MEKEIQQSIEVLKAGGIILYPTDTIWGIGCDAKNEEAVQRIIQLKKREQQKSFIVLLDDSNKLPSYVKQVPDMAWDLIEFAENPLTIVFTEGRNLAPSVLNKDGSIGIRIVKAGFAKELIRKFRSPIVSTSANISGQSSPTIFSEISEDVLNKVDHVVHLPDEGTQKPSTIMRIEENGRFSFLRR